MPTRNSLLEDYEILGLMNGATLDEVKQAYRDLAKVWHPDRFSQDDTRLRKKAEEKLKCINDAYARIKDSLSHKQPHNSCSADAASSLKEDADSITALILLVSATLVNLQMKMVTGSTGREEIDAGTKEFFALNREAISRVEALIRRFEREMPEYPRTELEAIRSKLSEHESSLTKAVAEYGQTQSEKHQKARRPNPRQGREPNPRPRVSVDAPSFAGYADKESKNKRHWIWAFLFLLVAAALCLIFGRSSSVPSQPSASKPSEATAVEQSSPLESQPAAPSTSAVADEKLATQDDSNAQPTDAEQGVRETVEAWANAFRARDIDQLADCYAPEVEQYFRKKNVPRSQIHNYFQGSFNKIEGISTYNISDLHVEFLDGSASTPRATATYNKEWDTSQIDGKRFSGEEVERLTLEKTDEGWKIVREEELQIIRASRWSGTADQSPSMRGIVTDSSSASGDAAKKAPAWQQPEPRPQARVSELPAPEKRVQVTAGVAVGMLLEKVNPTYPPIAKAARVSGTVVLAAVIGRDGSIHNLSVVSGPAMLQSAAIEAVKQWKYLPYVMNGEAVDVETQINVIFTLGG